MLDDEIEAVIVTTFHPTHADLCIKALEAGKNVLTEKPIATSPADAARIKEAVDKYGKILMALPYDNYPQMEEAKRLLRIGAIGTVNSADAIFAHQGPIHAPWFFDKTKAEWGVLADLGIYPISILTYLFGPAESVLGRVSTVFPERTSLSGERFQVTVEDNAAAIIIWSNGIMGTIRSNWCTSVDKNDSVWEIKIYGSKGIIFINMASKENSLVVYSPYAPIDGAEKAPYNELAECYRPKLADSDAHLDILRSFANAVQTDTPFPSDGVSIVRQQHVIEIIDKIYRSSETGAVQILQTRF
ncbi:Oxidoreductase, NAD-binding domain protein [[Clostridium] ultunense Esp]|nr:Oxidoreductase, NAD-binding domain protein [[Clostridium] ultunense Esp]